MHWSVVERTIHVGHRECINGSNILSLPPSDEAYGRSTSDNGSDEATTTTTTTPSTTSGDGDKWTKEFLYNIWRHNHCDVLWHVHTVYCSAQNSFKIAISDLYGRQALMINAKRYQ